MNSKNYTPNDVIEELYMLLDDIDTLGDMCKGDYEWFFNATMEKCKKRFTYYELFKNIARMKESLV